MSTQTQVNAMQLFTDTPPESLKTFCDQLARAATAGGAAEIMRMFRFAGLTGDGLMSVAPGTRNGAAKKPTPVIAAGASNRIGIWERQEVDGVTSFVRAMDTADDWFSWANVQRIEPKGAKPRVVLMGESVAKGYLYHPEFTPTMALRTIFKAHFGADEIEVIDLSRTGLAFEVRELAIAALALEPDVAIVFSGNNLRTAKPDVLFADLDAVVREQGLAGFRRLTEDALALRVDELVADIASCYSQAKVPLIWMIPEFNLKDWRTPSTNAPHLPGDGNSEWLSLLDQAHAALRRRDLPKATELASELTQLDQGVCVAGWYILAECSRLSNDLQAENAHLESARDAVHWYASGSPPATTSRIQQTLRTSASREGNEVLDVPELFREYLNGGIPGRQLFLDYCHMTAEGIRVAMAAAASRVIRLLGGRLPAGKSGDSADVPWRALIHQEAAPSPEVQAEAAFLAAVHNAHWWQPSEVVRHHCEEAIRLAPYIAQVMKEFIDSQTRRTPMLMSSATERIAGLSLHQLRPYLLRLKLRQLDRPLIEEFGRILATVGMETASSTNRLRCHEHSVSQGPIDLLDYYYCSSALPPQEVMGALRRRDESVVARESRYFKAYWRESRFLFIAEAGCCVRLRLACRFPNLPEGTLAISVNGAEAAELVGHSHWQNWDIDVPGEIVLDGVNEVSLRWPLPAFPGTVALAEIASDLADQIFPEFYCIFGEIDTFIAESTGQIASQSGRPNLTRRRAGIRVA